MEINLVIVPTYEIFIVRASKIEIYLTTKIMCDPLNVELNGLTKMTSLHRESLVRSLDYSLVYCYFINVLPEFSQ